MLDNPITLNEHSPFEATGSVEDRLARIETKLGNLLGAIARLSIRLEDVLENEGKLRKPAFSPEARARFGK